MSTTLGLGRQTTPHYTVYTYSMCSMEPELKPESKMNCVQFFIYTKSKLCTQTFTNTHKGADFQELQLINTNTALKTQKPQHKNMNRAEP